MVQQVTSQSLTALDDVAYTMSRCQWDTVCGVQDAAGGGTEQRASGPVRERERERARAVDVVVVVVVVDGMHVMLSCAM